MTITSVKDKRVAVTGTFVDISRTDAEKGLVGLGAILSDVSKHTAMLFAGQGGGSKRTKAQSLGIPVYGEEELLALLRPDGDIAKERHPEATTAEPAAGPLANFIARFRLMVAELQKHPEVVVLHYSIAKPAPETTLNRVRQALGGLHPAVENVYRQCNGAQLMWVDKKNPDVDEVVSIATQRKVARKFTAYELDILGSRIDGVVNLAPVLSLADVGAGKGLVWFDFMKDEELRFAQGLRVFDWYYFFNMAALQLQDGGTSDTVYIGDDHGACFTDFPTRSFETYMQAVLAGFGAIKHRGSTEPRSLDTVLAEVRRRR